MGLNSRTEDGQMSKTGISLKLRLLSFEFESMRLFVNDAIY